MNTAPNSKLSAAPAETVIPIAFNTGVDANAMNPNPSTVDKLHTANDT